MKRGLLSSSHLCILDACLLHSCLYNTKNLLRGGKIKSIRDLDHFSYLTDHSDPAARAGTREQHGQERADPSFPCELEVIACCETIPLLPSEEPSSVFLLAGCCPVAACLSKLLVVAAPLRPGAFPEGGFWGFLWERGSRLVPLCFVLPSRRAW